MRHVESVLRANVTDLFGHQDVMNLLAQGGDATRAGIRASSEMVSALTNVCRALLVEGVSIRAFDAVCRTFRELHADGVRPRVIAERIRLLHGVRETLPGREGHSYMRAGETLEDELRGSLLEHNRRALLAMLPERCQETLAAIRTAVAGNAGSQPLALVVADSVLRPYVRRLVELEFPRLPGLSAAEAKDDVPFVSTRIELDTSSGTAELDFRSPVASRSQASPGIEIDNLAPRANIVEPRAPAPSPGVAVTLAPGAITRHSPADSEALPSLVGMMQVGLFHELGVLVPIPSLQESRSVTSPVFRLRMNDAAPVEIEGLGENEFLVNETVDRLRLVGVPGDATTNPANGHAATVVANVDDLLQRCRSAGLMTWGSPGHLVLHLTARIRHDAASFQNDDATRMQLESVEAAHPDVARLAVERYGLPCIGQVLRHLLAEEISVKNLRAILEGLLCLDGSSDVDQGRFIVFTAHAEPVAFDTDGRTATQLPPWMLADHVRTCLRRYISHKYTRGKSTLVVYLLEPSIEARLRDAALRPLTESDWVSLVEAVRDEVGPEPEYRGVALLTTIEVRLLLRQLLRDAFPGMPVLSYQELSPEINIQPVARIHWASAEAAPESVAQ